MLIGVAREGLGPPKTQEESAQDAGVAVDTQSRNALVAAMEADAGAPYDIGGQHCLLMHCNDTTGGLA